MSPTARLSRAYNSDNATDMTPDQIMLEDVQVTFETKSKLCIKYPISNLFKLLLMEYNTVSHSSVSGLPTSSGRDFVLVVTILAFV